MWWVVGSLDGLDPFWTWSVLGKNPRHPGQQNDRLALLQDVGGGPGSKPVIRDKAKHADGQWGGCASLQRERRERGREGERERGREGERENGRMGEWENGRKGGRMGEKEGEWEKRRENGRKGGRMREKEGELEKRRENGRKGGREGRQGGQRR